MKRRVNLCCLCAPVIRLSGAVFVQVRGWRRSGRVPVHVVSQRLGHANAVVTMTVYAHVLPGSGREAANLLASLIGKAAA